MKLQRVRVLVQKSQFCTQKFTVITREHFGEGDLEGGSHQAAEEGVGGAADDQILRKVVHNKSYSTLALHLRVLP